MRITTIFTLFTLVAAPAFAIQRAEYIDTRDFQGYGELDARELIVDEIDARDLSYDAGNVITARDLADAMANVIHERALATGEDPAELEARLFGAIFKAVKTGIGMIHHHKKNH